MGKLKTGMTAVLLLLCVSAAFAQTRILSGSVFTTQKEALPYATVILKGTAIGCATDEDGAFRFEVPEGNHTLIVSAIGYEPFERALSISKGEEALPPVFLKESSIALNEVAVTASAVEQVKRTAFNAVAVDTKHLQNSTKNLSDALANAPGLKLRESGGVGSDMQLTLDGFSGKHVKVFIDGVPQEGVGSSFSLNNIPINFAERIEVYKGVVPVGLGADAIGGVINIVTNKRSRRWFVDASYAYGSFHTHKSSVHFGQTLPNGWMYECQIFQNYSDNDYYVEAPVKDFETGRLDTEKKERVKRFNDTYHNEAIVAKAGWVNRPWADRLLLGVTFSNVYKEIQTGVRQITVYGEKHRKAHALTPSVAYYKRDLLAKGMDLTLTANYNLNQTTHVDTSAYTYNWAGEKKLMNSRGEQAYQHTRSNNNNWNTRLNLSYRLGETHLFTFNSVWNAFKRSNTSLLTHEPMTDAISKETRKLISGLSYRLMPSEHWNLSLFGKHYRQWVSGPMATSSTADAYIRTSHQVNAIGYGAASTYLLQNGWQTKLSYEKAYRLPTIEETFGNEDLELGDIDIRPEQSDNLNLNISFNKRFQQHTLYAESGVVFRNTKDYIQRNITDLSGGRQAATYINYGKVRTKGINLSLRYQYAQWLSLGGNYTLMDIRDHQQYALGSQTPNLAYKARMPNLPYHFADTDLSLTWANCDKKGSRLTLTYDNQYLHSFSYYSSAVGADQGEYVVPNQFAHNLSLAYNFGNGRYNLSVECKNLTDRKLYDNFSLQKAGRAFYGKIRLYLGTQ